MIGTFSNSIQRRRDERGLTLVELLIVIVILGILSAIVVFSIGGITDKGTDSACNTTGSAILTASEAAYAQTGTYPTSNGDLAGFIVWPTNVDHSGGTTVKYPKTGTAKWTLNWTAGVAASGTAVGTAPSYSCS